MNRVHLLSFTIIITVNYVTALFGFCSDLFFPESSENDDLPPRSDYDRIDFTGSQVLDIMRVHDSGPPTLQGLIWLNVSPDQGFSEVVSLAKSTEGGGLSTGKLRETNPAYRIRTLGDRIWAYTGYPAPFYPLTIKFDATFDFVLTDGNTTHPKRLSNRMDLGIPFTCKRIRAGGCVDVLWTWDMTLQNTPDSFQDEYSPHPIFSTSVVWRRDSTWLSGIISDSVYEVIQIVDGAGNKLQPAYDAFIKQEGGRVYTTYELRSKVSPPLCPKKYW